MPPAISTSRPWRWGGKAGLSGMLQSSTLAFTSSGASDTNAQNRLRTVRAVSIGYTDPANATTRADRMQPIFERRDNAEVASAAFERPEQIGVGRFADVQEAAVGGHDVRGQETIARHPVGAAQPALSSSERQIPIPVVDMTPPAAARPKGCVSRSRSPDVAPPSARTRRPATSTRTPFISDKSITMPPSQVANPATL